MTNQRPVFTHQETGFHQVWEAHGADPQLPVSWLQQPKLKHFCLKYFFFLKVPTFILPDCPHSVSACVLQDSWENSPVNWRVSQSEANIQVKWPALTNQRQVFRSRDLYWPIRGKYSGHVTSIDQSDAGSAFTRCLLTNERILFSPLIILARPVFSDQSLPIRGQYLCFVLTVCLLDC